MYVLILKTGHTKKMSYVGEFASWDLSEIFPIIKPLELNKTVE